MDGIDEMEWLVWMDGRDGRDGMDEIGKMGRMGWTGWMDEMDGMDWMDGRMAAMGWIMKFNHDGRPLQYTQTLTMKLTSEAKKLKGKIVYPMNAMG